MRYENNIPKPTSVQARERLTSYRGRMTVKVCWEIGEHGAGVRSVVRDCGLVPIMVRVSVSYMSHHSTMADYLPVRSM
jgi:hypothetical protein